MEPQSTAGVVSDNSPNRESAAENDKVTLDSLAGEHDNKSCQKVAILETSIFWNFLAVPDWPAPWEELLTNSPKCRYSHLAVCRSQKVRYN